MDTRKYETDGSYAAKVDHVAMGQSILLENVVIAIAAMNEHLIVCSSKCKSHDWAMDYIQTALNLLGFRVAAELVKKDFEKALNAFSTELRLRSFLMSC